MKQILLDVAYRLRKPPFLFALLLSGAMFYQGFFAESEGDVLYYYQMSLSYGTFYVLAPLIAALPLVGTLSRELKGGLRAYHVVRAGTTRFLVNRAISSMFTGGLTLMGGPLLVCMALLTNVPITGPASAGIYSTQVNASFCSLLILHHDTLFLALKLLLLFVMGASSAMVTLAAAAYSKSPFVALFTPFILFRASDLFIRPHVHALFTIFGLTSGYVVGVPFDDTWGFLAYAIGIQAVLWLILFIVAWLGMRRRFVHA